MIDGICTCMLVFVAVPREEYTHHFRHLRIRDDGFLAVRHGEDGAASDLSRSSEECEANLQE